MQKSKKYDAYWVTRQDIIYNITLTLYNSRLRQDIVRTILYPPLKKIEGGEREPYVDPIWVTQLRSILVLLLSHTCSASIKFSAISNSWKHFKLSYIRHTCLTSSHKWLIPLQHKTKRLSPFPKNLLLAIRRSSNVLVPLPRTSLWWTPIRFLAIYHLQPVLGFWSPN